MEVGKVRRRGILWVGISVYVPHVLRNAAGAAQPSPRGDTVREGERRGAGADIHK